MTQVPQSEIGFGNWVVFGASELVNKLDSYDEMDDRVRGKDFTIPGNGWEMNGFTALFFHVQAYRCGSGK